LKDLHRELRQLREWGEDWNRQDAENAKKKVAEEQPKRTLRESLAVFLPSPSEIRVIRNSR
jgi:hypothetical protein